jgi:hypothetical protein
LPTLLASIDLGERPLPRRFLQLSATPEKKKVRCLQIRSWVSSRFDRKVQEKKERIATPGRRTSDSVCPPAWANRITPSLFRSRTTLLTHAHAHAPRSPRPRASLAPLVPQRLLSLPSGRAGPTAHAPGPNRSLASPWSLALARSGSLDLRRDLCSGA